MQLEVFFNPNIFEYYCLRLRWTGPMGFVSIFVSCVHFEVHVEWQFAWNLSHSNGWSVGWPVVVVVIVGWLSAICRKFNFSTSHCKWYTPERLVLFVSLSKQYKSICNLNVYFSHRAIPISFQPFTSDSVCITSIVCRNYSCSCGCWLLSLIEFETNGQMK